MYGFGRSHSHGIMGKTSRIYVCISWILSYNLCFVKTYILEDLEIYHIITSLLFRPRQNPTPNAATYIEPSARKDMEGSYLCRAKNAAGETEDLVQVIVNENGDGGRSGK